MNAEPNAKAKSPRTGVFAALAVFTTLALLPAAALAATPTVTLDPIAVHSIVTAHATGEVSVDSEANGGAETYWCFEATVEGQEQWSQGSCGGGVAPETSEPIAGNLTGLAAGKHYEARISYLNFNDFLTEYSAIQSFETDPATAPTLALDAPGTVGYTTAHISGKVDPEGGNEDAVAGVLPISWQLQVNREGSGWNTVQSGALEGAEAQSDPAPGAGIPVAADATGLAPGAAYKFRLVATYAGLQVPSGEGEFTTLAVTKPTPEALQVTAITAASAHFQATVKTNAPGGLDAAGEAAYAAHWSFSPGGSSGTVPATTATEAVAGDATGLEPHHPYTATLTVANAGGSEEISVPFETTAVAPDVAPETLWEPTPTSIQLNARVNAHNAALSDCHFEWGATAAYGHTAPCESPLADGTYSPPADNSSHVVSARLSGLVPNSEYHFRLLATNSADTVEGSDRSVTTLPGAAPQAACSNQAIRAQQHATALPDCRAYEMVSPLDKNGGDIEAGAPTDVASTSGDGIAYASVTPFGDTVGSGGLGQNVYLSRRGEDGWSAHALMPTPRPDALQTFLAFTKVQVFSVDLSSALAWGYDLPGASDDEPNREDLYLEDTATRALRPLNTSQAAKRSFFDMVEPNIWGASADVKHVSFLTNTQMLPEGAAPGYPNGAGNVYTWNDGTLELAGILPDGSVPPEGSTVFPVNYRGAMSADGTRQAFNASAVPGGPSQLFLRIDGNRTVWVSEPEGSEQEQPQNVIFQGMTPDGNSVFFVSDSPLLNADSAPGPDLYRWTYDADPENTPNLTLISHDGSVQGNQDGTALIGMSDDGNRVYYQGVNGELSAWDHGVTKRISSDALRDVESQNSLAVTAAAPGNARVTPDGRWLSFLTKSALDHDSIHGLTGRITDGKYELYLYSLATDTLTCVSCPSGTTSSNATVTPRVNGAQGVGWTAVRPRFLSDSGRVFFSTRDALLPTDVNGVDDTYSYDAASGALTLLSSGKGDQPTDFADASPSGSDVFLLTRQRLASPDSDTLVDLYDARVDGGFSASESAPAPPCDGDACQPASQAPPAPAPLLSQAGAAGNVHSSRRCPKHTGAGAKHHSPKRCANKKHPHKRTANHDRRASR